MTPLRQRMIEDLQLRGMSERTQEMYVRAVHQLAAHYHKSRMVKIFELAFPLEGTPLPSPALRLVFRSTLTHTQRP